MSDFEMELEDAHDIDLQTERMLHILTLENTNVKLEPEFHIDDGTKLSENAKYTDHITTVVVKTEVIDNDHYEHTSIHYNRDMRSNSNYIETGMRRDTHIAPVKSERPDERLETNDRTEFVIEIDTCKDEYYETYGYPNSQSNVNFEESLIENETGGDRVTKEDKYMEHSDPQLGHGAIHTSVHTTPHTAAPSDMKYTYLNAVSQSSLQVHGREPTIRIPTLATECVYGSQQSNHKPYVCSFCGVGFTHNCDMKTHVMIHTGEKPHKCDICEISFVRKNTLTTPIQTHTGEKPYKCTVCGDEFTQKQHLTMHTRTHTGEKPHKCYVCNVSFTQKCHLTSHIRTHTGEKPHKCSVCNVSFTQKCQLTYHLRTHTGEKPYKCTVCGDVFTRKHGMKRHIRKHTGEKPHKCSVCEVSFTDKGHLTRHMRTHTGEKPYKCPVCGIRLGHANTLKKHMARHDRSHT